MLQTIAKDANSVLKQSSKGGVKMTDSEKDLLLNLLTKWQDEEVEKELKMDTDIVMSCTRLILKLQEGGKDYGKMGIYDIK